MSRWLRLYDDTINDPKVLKLPEALRWHWIALLCVASKNGGALPALDDIAIQLRMTAAKTTETLMKLVKSGLIDKTDAGFAPHNWGGRQYKSDRDETAAVRSKKYRDAKRGRHDSVTRDATHQSHPPETDTETDTNSVAVATDAIAPIDHRKRLFGEGLAKLSAMTGKGPDACRSFVGKCLKAANDDAITVLGLIEDAERNRVVDPSAWIAARLKPTGPPSFAAKPLTEHQRKQQETREILNDLANFAAGRSDSSEPNPGLLRYDPGGRPEGVRGGAGGDADDLPPQRH